jgi:hypothetical protein
MKKVATSPGVSRTRADAIAVGGKETPFHSPETDHSRARATAEARAPEIRARRRAVMTTLWPRPAL